MAFEFGPRRSVYLDIAEEMDGASPLPVDEQAALESFDLIYRSLCAILYNFVPQSGHPGGSISSGRFVRAILFATCDHDVSDPDRPDADLVSYAAGHKALGLYALWALRNEVARIAAPELLPKDERLQLRLEDLLGFRRNPVTSTPLFKQFNAKSLDGHPTPATPFLRLATGASGVGMASSIGLAFGARDTYGAAAPLIHIVEGEGGLTPGRSAEALAAAGTASLDNLILHLDWNQASIDSDHVCREGDQPGDYVQWDPRELIHLHDWNVIFAPDGHDLQQIASAQRRALTIDNGQPTAIVYRTVKGWHYGIEGKASHGAGHKLCSEGYLEALRPWTENHGITLPTCDADDPRCRSSEGEAEREDCFWCSLVAIRQSLEAETGALTLLAAGLRSSRERLDARARKPRPGAPDAAKVFAAAAADAPAPDLGLAPGGAATLRGTLGKVFGHYNQISGGALLAAAADLLDSTSVSGTGAGFPAGLYHSTGNPESRILSLGGICEDALTGIMTGVSAYGRHVGVASSYAAFIAALGHVSLRLHAIGAQARREIVADDPYRTMILLCAHAGLKTGEDGPTHADPQALQLLQENFPHGTAITLTPWDPQEIWPLMQAAMAAHPAVLAPFVTRPAEPVLDRAALGLEPAEDATRGVYKLRAAQGEADGVVVLQGSGVTYAFVQETLPLLAAEGIELDVYYVASAELFDLLPADERERAFPAAQAARAMGVTGFTLPTLYRWVTSERGRAASLHPFGKGHYLGSGQADKVMAQAGLDSRGQFEAIRRYVKLPVRG